MNDRIGRVVKYDDVRAFGFVKEIGGKGTQQFFSINGVNDRVVLRIGDLVSFRVIDSTFKVGRTEAVDITLKLRTPEPMTETQALALPYDLSDKKDNLTIAQREYVIVKFNKFKSGGNNHINVCPIEGELFWLIFGQPCTNGKFTFPTIAHHIMSKTDVEKFYVVNENDVTDGKWFKTSECKTFEIGGGVQ